MRILDSLFVGFLCLTSAGSAWGAEPLAVFRSWQMW